MTFQPSAPHKRSRWLVLLAVVMLGTGMLATTALAAPTFNFTLDEQGPNDEPGQKDLTADATAIDPANNDYWTAWKWDATSWSGNNTGDACSLFDTSGDGNADYAVCVTIGKPAIETSTRVYSCTDNRPDRCTGATLEGTESAASNWCTVSAGTPSYPGNPSGDDTQATCNITLIASDLGLTGLDNGTFLNSCSYPSQEPNSDPSDCVHRVFVINVTIDTAPTAITTWTATLNDRVQLTPNTAQGSVVFKLWNDSACTSNVWTSNSVPLSATGFATSVGAGTASGNNVITQATTDSDLTFYWSIVYTATSPYVAPATPPCGETTTITPASVSPNLTTYPAP